MITSPCPPFSDRGNTTVHACDRGGWDGRIGLKPQQEPFATVQRRLAP